MEKILVEWSIGRSKGTTSLVKKNTVKKGTSAIGEKVVGKSKRTFNAKVISVSIGVLSAEIPIQDTSNNEAFAFELVDPAPPTRAVDLPGPSQPKLRARQEDSSIALLIDKLDNLADAMSRVEAWLCQLQTLEEEVAALKKEISEECIPHPQSLEYQPLPSSFAPLYPTSASTAASGDVNTETNALAWP